MKILLTKNPVWRSHYGLTAPAVTELRRLGKSISYNNIVADGHVYNWSNKYREYLNTDYKLYEIEKLLPHRYLNN